MVEIKLLLLLKAFQEGCTQEVVGEGERRNIAYNVVILGDNLSWAT